MENQNIGKWSAVVENDGKTPQLIVSGTFPTFGQKPVYELQLKEPQGIVGSELILVLTFGRLVNSEGAVFFSVTRSFPIEHVEMYKTVLIVDENERTIANIMITPENNKLDDSISFVPYLEVLKGIDVSGSSLKVRVPSNGLTDKASFHINIIKGFTGIPPYVLEIFRVVPDDGRAYFPDGVVLEYTPQELNETSFSVYILSNQIG